MSEFELTTAATSTQHVKTLVENVFLCKFSLDAFKRFISERKNYVYLLPTYFDIDILFVFD